MAHQAGQHFPLIISLPPLAYSSEFYPLLNFPGHVCATAIACKIGPVELASHHLTWGLIAMETEEHRAWGGLQNLLEKPALCTSRQCPQDHGQARGWLQFVDRSGSYCSADVPLCNVISTRSPRTPSFPLARFVFISQ